MLAFFVIHILLDLVVLIWLFFWDKFGSIMLSPEYFLSPGGTDYQFSFSSPTRGILYFTFTLTTIMDELSFVLLSILQLGEWGIMLFIILSQKGRKLEEITFDLNN